ncbi:unnamed protein product, partial [Prorocentrum cordatum]
MIYIFRSCEACTNGCGKAVGAVCNPLCRVLDRPLGSYAFLTGAVNALSCLLAILSLGDDMRCSSGESAANLFAMMNVAASIVHAGFALYLQQRLVRGLQRNAALGNHGSTARQLMKEAGDIVLYDVGFCLYVFFFVAAFFVQFWGFSVLGGCRDAGTAWGSATLQVLFCLGAVAFGFCWSCAMQCSDCCGLFSPGAARQPLSGGLPGQPQPQRGPVGLTRLIVGSSNMTGPPSLHAGAVVMGTPVQRPPPSHTRAGRTAPQSPPPRRRRSQRRRSSPSQRRPRGPGRWPRPARWASRAEACRRPAGSSGGAGEALVPAILAHILCLSPPPPPPPPPLSSSI